MMDLHTTLMFLLRWIHLIAGITWIGLLYFFNFINIPLTGTLDADSKKKVVPELMPRTLFFFRWGAMFTFLTGAGIIIIKYFVVGSGMTGPSGLMSTPGGLWITFGALFGTVMWFNVWFIIWPAQQKIIPAVKAGEAPPAGLARKSRDGLPDQHISLRSASVLHGRWIGRPLPDLQLLHTGDRHRRRLRAREAHLWILEEIERNVGEEASSLSWV